ncbi:hypothetical protein PMAYCL1PPCAC_03138 [Pristionchus mayeri]|uniref:G-protein coupled receptors family 1 profile domain-containing protein n=1 Tax=Pristionchus mayeri TaxID=1317129 RepID=A0AAN5C139_9BILA|nr:hypothetical protein PMAYCL1PPCAC_03138 [Pristionchus mayeri]
MNNSSEGSLLPRPPPPPLGPFGLAPHIFFIVMHLSATMTLAILGNLLLVFVIVRGNRVARRRLSPVQLLLLHTCTADFLFAFFSLGTEIRLLIAHPHFPGPDPLCSAVHYMQMVPLYASPFLLVAISADRYQAICRPLDNFRQSRYRRPNCMAAVAWTLALLLSIPQLFVWKMVTYTLKSGHTISLCRTTYGQGQTWFKTFYILMFNGLAWLLPSFLAGFFYYNVCKAVWMSHRPDKKFVKCEEKNNMATQRYIDKLREASCGHKRQSTEYDRKRTQTVRLTMTIIACNFFLWAPFCITNIIQAISPEMISKEAIIFFVIFGNLNSCVNPWIYILFNRKHVARAFCGRVSKGCHRSETDGQPSRHFNGSNNNKEISSFNLRAHHERASNGFALYTTLVGEPNASGSAKTSFSTDKTHVRFSDAESSPTSSIGTERATFRSRSTTTLTNTVRASESIDDLLPRLQSDYGIDEDDTVTTALIDVSDTSVRPGTLGSFIADLARKGRTTYCNGSRLLIYRSPSRSTFTSNEIYV